MPPRGPRPMIAWDSYQPIREALRKRVYAMIRLSMPDILTPKDVFELFVPTSYQDLSRQWGELTRDTNEKAFWSHYKWDARPMRIFIKVDGGAYVFAEPPQMGKWISDDPHLVQRLEQAIGTYAALHQKYGMVVSLFDMFQNTMRLNQALVYLPAMKHLFTWGDVPIDAKSLERPAKIEEIGRELTLACYEANETLTAMSLLKSTEVPERAVRFEARPISGWVTRFGKVVENF